MAVAVRYFEFDKAQHDKWLITEDPSLVFSIVKVARDQTQTESLLARLRRQDDRPWERGWINNNPKTRRF